MKIMELAIELAQIRESKEEVMKFAGCAHPFTHFAIISLFIKSESRSWSATLAKYNLALHNNSNYKQ